MKKAYLLLSVCGLPLWLGAQLTTTITINTNKERQAISPYVYSTNAQSFDRPENITGRRLGGNRMTSYNWEDNFSNGGADYINDNDNYMPYSINLPFADYLVPNIVLTAFHDTSLSMNCTSLITLPMCSYVSRDGNGVVSSSPPSPRWRQVVNNKGSAFVYPPDTADNFVYVDECMNNLITVFGNSTSTNGIKNYEMDNEWSIWNTSQPLLHPTQPTIAEAISRSTNLSETIKRMDPNSLAFGPVDYGYASYLEFQNATDWSSYSSYGTFCGAYLAFMKHASDSIGHRLLDVYDVHYYSSAQGLDSSNNLEVVDGGDNDVGVATARMESPRTLWDSSYVENSWIGQFYSPVVYIRAIQNNINTYYPGTKIAFTEFSYGGENHISGGIALADMLGICGRFGVYWTSVWGPVNQFWGSGYKIFRNYDGRNSTFGNTHVYANTNDWRTSSVYAAIQSTDTNTMNVIVMNKDYDSTLKASLTISANTVFNKAKIYAFNQYDTNIHYIGSMPISGNQFNYTVPVLSAYHFVLTDSLVNSTGVIKNNDDVAIYPNPSTGLFTITFNKATVENLTVDILDVTGKVVKTFFVKSNTTSATLDLQDMPDGVYLARLTNSTGIVIKKLVKE
jgi:mannan endo-1,4-beta-mannosidase